MNLLNKVRIEIIRKKQCDFAASKYVGGGNKQPKPYGNLSTKSYGNLSTKTLKSSWHTTSYPQENLNENSFFDSTIKNTEVKYVSLSKLDGTTV